MSAVPLADVKAHLNITSSTDDTELQSMLDAAETAISRMLGGSGTMASTAVSQRVSGDCATALALTNLPVVSVESVTDASGAAQTMGDLDIDLAHGLVRFKYSGHGYAGARTGTFTSPYYTVAYHTGWVPLPADLVLAVKELVRHFWQTQRGSTARPGQANQDQMQFPSQVGAYPQRVLELVRGYTAPGFA